MLCHCAVGEELRHVETKQSMSCRVVECTFSVRLKIDFMLLAVVFRLLLNQSKHCSASTMFVEYVPNIKFVIKTLYISALDVSCNKLVTAIISYDLKWHFRIR